MNFFYKSDNGRILQGDNLEILKKFKDKSVDSCISDLPYDLSFMNKGWDTTEDFYKWCNERALELYRVMKAGSYTCMFGHPKTNHRMKCAFEDAGFKIVEEIAWIYLTGFPKSQDIGKLFDKNAGVEREIIGKSDRHSGRAFGLGSVEGDNIFGKFEGGVPYITAPTTEKAKKWNGWKTCGLKPAHETITVFQKPLDGTYIQNIDKHGVGAFNIDACRIPMSFKDKEMINAKASKYCSKDYYENDNAVFGKYEKTYAKDSNSQGRFPPNICFDEVMAKVLDEYTGISKSTGGKNTGGMGKNILGKYKLDKLGKNAGGLNDIGGGSRIFPIFKYCPKVAPKERKLPNGERNPHVTLKPAELIKWLIKLVTPKNGITLDITAGSCTHAVACELLNRDEGYNLKWIDIELNNSKENPYCDVGKLRIEELGG